MIQADPGQGRPGSLEVAPVAEPGRVLHRPRAGLGGAPHHPLLARDGNGVGGAGAQALGRRLSLLLNEVVRVLNHELAAGERRRAVRDGGENAALARRVVGERAAIAHAHRAIRQRRKGGGAANGCARRRFAPSARGARR